MIVLLPRRGKRLPDVNYSFYAPYLVTQFSSLINLRLLFAVESLNAFCQRPKIALKILILQFPLL